MNGKKYKMKIKLTAQKCSASVAFSLEFLEHDLKDPKFEGDLST